MGSATLILLLFPGLAIVFGSGRIIGHIIKTDKLITGKK